MAFKIIPQRLRRLSFSLIFVLASISFSFGQNAIVTENLLPGSPRSVWDEGDQGSIQGFATEFSVNKGSTIRFKIDIDATINVPYAVDIYRIGYYQGNGARFITNITNGGLGLTGQNQPAFLYETATGKADCSNWTESCHWDVPANAVSGVYVARLDCAAVAGTALIIFVVRDDAANSQLLFKTSDATWQAYSNYGGNTFYNATIPVPGYTHATKLSYQRPLTLRGNKTNFFNSEFPMILWLERNGYDVSYATDMDMARDATAFTPAKHKALLSVGHDEYWSAEQRSKYETARNNGVNIAWFSGNDVYWKTRWEDNYQTLVCYKEGTEGLYSCGTKCDPQPNVWTGLWRDGCLPAYGANDGCSPEGTLIAQMGWTESTGSIEVPDTYKDYRFWKNTNISVLGAGQTATLPYGTLGEEWDQEAFTETFPQHTNSLSFTTMGGLVHRMRMYKHNSGALVFSAGTMQWSWGLDNNHDRTPVLPPSLDIQQATYNILFDMGADAGSKQVDIVDGVPSTDNLAPTTIITSPVHNASVPGSPITISGTCSDNGGGAIGGVEVSTDDGLTWNKATGLANWSYSFSPNDYGTVFIKVRAWDDVFNVEVPGALGSGNYISINLTGPFTHSVFDQKYPTSLPPFVFLQAPIELGMKFRSSSPGFVTALMYYKAPSGSGLITGNLWSSTGTLLATKDFTSETASGWQTVQLTTPVAITANTTYIVSYFSPLGKYVEENPFFTTTFNNGLLSGLADGQDGRNGVINFGASGFPTEGTQGTTGTSNFYPDVVFISSVINPPQVISTSPANNATLVSLTVAPSATFDEFISPGTVTSSTVILTGPGNVVIPGTASVSGAVVTFTPTAALNINTVYTMRLKGGTGEPVIKDYSGNKLAADYTWSFTTEFTHAPIVTTDPLPQTTCANSSISFTSVASGFPTPTVQWQVSTDNGTTWNNIPGAINPLYSFTATVLDNNNLYHAVWTNGLGSATSDPALLTIASITGAIAAVNAVICVGTPLQLQLTSATGPSPYTLQINSNTYTGINVGQTFTPLASGVDENVFGVLDVPDELIHVDNIPIEVGVKFKTNKAGVIRGIRFYKGSTANGGTHKGTLWSQSGTLLATATFSGETSSGWQEVLFSTPVAVTPNTTYVASAFLPLGNYSKSENYFTNSAHSNGNSLTALQFSPTEPNGVYKYNASSTFPNQFFGEPNYWVDVVFTPYATATTTFNLTSITAANGCNTTGSPLSSATITVVPGADAGTIIGNASLCVGLTGTYTSTGDGGGTWTSSNPGIASVGPLTGIVTALSTGTVILTYAVDGCTGTVSVTKTITVSVCPTIVNLKLYLQGYYIGGGQMEPVLLNQNAGVSTTETDNITVELHNTTAPFSIVAVNTAILNTDGTIAISFPPVTGPYYIAVKHRNTVQTWSANPVTVGPATPLYDFSTALNKAYGNNMIQIGSVWAMYTGDINQDEFIDIFDYPAFENDNLAGVGGVYSTTDMNGDGFVDVFDYPIFENNNLNGAESIHP